MANSNLHDAKRAKQDEFYTQWVDVENEMNAYLDYDPDVFRDKTILLPCDDPEWSNFTKYFALRFQDFGIKKLISTSYAPRGKIFVLDGADVNGDGKVNIEDFDWEYLEGDGDFRSDEITRLRDEADMVITNPPFSLFREFVAWLEEGGVEYAVIGNMNAITYKEVFPLIKENKMWLGTHQGGMVFRTPMDYGKNNSFTGEDGVTYQKLGNVVWFTNVQHGRRHEPIPLMTMEDNLRFNKKIMKSPVAYQRYDNYDAIEVPVTAGIPSDYTVERTVMTKEYEELIAAGFVLEVLDEAVPGKGTSVRILNPVMGVPISFLEKYCQEQFEIVGSSGVLAQPLIIDGKKKSGAFYVQGKRLYNRIAIRYIMDGVCAY